MSPIITEDQYPGLPKWPSVYVTGKSVTPEQARDIIMRTDTFVQTMSPYAGNDRLFVERVLRDSGWKELLDEEERYYDEIRNDPVAAREMRDKAFAPFSSSWELRLAWQEQMGVISTEYVYNSHFCSSYIYGPTGWCGLDGTIAVNGHNYGKWPNVENIVSDWRSLAKAFPYLDLCCTLHNEEARAEDPAIPVVTIKVCNGEVTVHEPDLSMHEPLADTYYNPTIDVAIMNIITGKRERGWPEEWVRDFCERSKAVLAKLMANKGVQ